MSANFIDRLNDNSLVNYGKDQLYRQWLINLGLLSIGMKMTVGIVTEPKKTASQWLNGWSDAWQTSSGLFERMVEQGRQVSAAKPK